ncbi:MAG: hypothetical protein GX605_13420, partial [Chloroflexi bacterium]|nr:hypothetical protein [Chloroflexota bacterium]
RTVILAALAVVGLGLLILWIKPFLLLRNFVPFLSHMRMPFRFYLVAPMALAALAGWGMTALRGRLRPQAFRVAAALAAALFLADVAPYARFFNLQWPLPDVIEPYAAFAADDRDYVLGSVYANGVLGDWGMTVADRPIAGGWLEWAAPRGRRGFLHGLEALGHEVWDEPQAAADLSALLAVSNAPYLIHPRLPDEGFVRRLEATPDFRLHQDGVRFSALENLRPTAYVQLYSAAVLFWDTRSGSDDLAAEERLARLVARAVGRGAAVVESATAESSQPYVFVAAQPGHGAADLVLPDEPAALRAAVDRLLPQAAAAPARQVSWERPAPEEIRVQVGEGSPALLTLAESWHPRWQVTQDGVALGAPLRANGGFQAVWLDGEAHSLVFRYQAPSLRWLGRGLTGLTLLACAALLLPRGDKRRQRR